MYPVFGIQGAGRFLGVSEWLFGALLLSTVKKTSSSMRAFTPVV
jgi:hypothetical protein